MENLVTLLALMHILPLMIAVPVTVPYRKAAHILLTTVVNVLPTEKSLAAGDGSSAGGTFS